MLEDDLFEPVGALFVTELNLDHFAYFSEVTRGISEGRARREAEEEPEKRAHGKKDTIRAVPEGIPFGEYHLLRRLGAGGMAEVFLAKKLGPRGFEKQLVIKRILPHLAVSERFSELFLNEARLAALIDHPNLVHVSGFGEIEGDYYLAMEFVDGTTIADLLAMFGTLTPGVAARVAIDLCAALAAIHTAVDAEGKPMQLVHRDVTPRNVMLTRDGNVKLLDFGIAVSRQDASNGAMGTKRHMSPEQAANQPLDHRSDLFSLGVLMYMMITGDLPFEGVPEGPPKRPPDLPDALWSTITRALAVHANERHASARQMQAELELFVASLGLEGTRAHLSDVVSVAVPRNKPLAVRALSTMTRILKLTTPLDEEDAPPASAGPSKNVLRFAFALSALLMAAAGAIFWMKLTGTPAPVAVPLEDTAPAPVLAVAQTPTIATEVIAPVAEVEPDLQAVPDPLPAETIADRKPKIGALTIDTKPWSEVYLGGKQLGITPLVAIKLPAGTHQLELKNPSMGISKRVKVTIRPGKTTRLQRDL